MEGVSGICRQAVRSDLGRVSSALLLLLVLVVVISAETLERSCPELLDVSSVRLNVITDSCPGWPARLQAHAAERMLGELLAPETLPPSRLVEVPIHNKSGTLPSVRPLCKQDGFPDLLPGPRLVPPPDRRSTLQACLF